MGLCSGCGTLMFVQTVKRNKVTLDVSISGIKLLNSSQYTINASVVKCGAAPLFVPFSEMQRLTLSVYARNPG